MRNAYIDADFLKYEVPFAAVASWRMFKEEQGIENDSLPSVDRVIDSLEAKVSSMLLASESSNPVFFFTGAENFRETLATTRKYKDRPEVSPPHKDNVVAYIKGKWDWEVHPKLEADDLLAIALTNDPNAICLTRDKDLLQVPGWHYQWETSSSPSLGPLLVEGYGHLEWDVERNKVFGYGDKFFFLQCLMGDSTDTIPGLPKIGVKKALKMLVDTNTYEEGLEVVVGAYKASQGDSWEEYLYEQANLVRMVRELENNEPVMWDWRV